MHHSCDHSLLQKLAPLMRVPCQQLLETLDVVKRAREILAICGSEEEVRQQGDGERVRSVFFEGIEELEGAVTKCK